MLPHHFTIYLYVTFSLFTFMLPLHYLPLCYLFAIYLYITTPLDLPVRVGVEGFVLLM